VPPSGAILIVSEDYAHVKEILHGLGYATAGVPDQETAREVFNSMRPGLVIADYPLAATHGKRSLAYYVRDLSRYPRTPMLAIVDRNAGLARQALDERFDDVCSRKCDPAVLRAKVRNLIGLTPETPQS
jgi:DNA-binding response OmpR family regulator